MNLKRIFNWDNIAVSLLIVCVVGIVAIFVNIISSNRVEQPATVIQKSYQKEHTESGVVKWEESHGKTHDTYYRAQVREYPDRYWLTLKRDRFFASDTYEIQVDRSTYEKAERGKLLREIHHHRADFDLIAWGTVHEGNISYAWEPAWDEAHDFAREYDTDIQRTEVWL